MKMTEIFYELINERGVFELKASNDIEAMEAARVHWSSRYDRNPTLRKRKVTIKTTSVRISL